MNHYVEKCYRVKDWFMELGRNKKEMWERVWNDELDKVKGNVLTKL